MNTFDQKYQTIATILMEYGGLVSPALIGAEWAQLSAYCAEVSATPPRTDAERAVVESTLNDILTDSVFHPNYRAHYVNQARELPHLEAFSHYIERATFQYYKHDFLGCVLCLIPAVEGTLRSYCGWAMGTPDPTPQLIRGALRNGQATRGKSRRDLYAESLASFHERWFWTKTTHADFRLSHLNRHYALHGLGKESFYRSTDCNRLFLFFILFAELLMLESNRRPHVFLPVEDPPVARRREYYLKLIQENPTKREMFTMEEALLAEHKHYVADTNPPTQAKTFRQFLKAMAPLLIDLAKMPDSGEEPK